MIAEIKFKEVGKEHIGRTTYIGENITREFIIDWFGLEDDDVEWYKININ